MTNLIPSLSTKMMRFFAYTALFSMVSLSACKKEEDPSIDGTYIRFINVSPTLGTYNIYLDDKMINTAAIPFGGTVSYSAYNVGSRTVKYTTASSPQSVLTKQISLTVNQVQSAYLIDKNDKMDVLLVTDDMNVTSTTKAFVKFINLSPDAPALNLDVTGGANLVKDKTYKNGSTYIQVDPKTYDFDIKDSATGVVKTTLTGIDVVAGRYYTIVSRGLLTPGTNDQPFSAQSIINQ